MFLCTAYIWLVFSSASLIFAAPDYNERLTLKPLPFGSLLASFNFQTNDSISAFHQQRYGYFPRALGDILHHASTQELHLRFSSGRWDTETWGTRPWDGTREGGTGVELWAWINANDEEESFENWTTLVQSLSGLFCASINFVDSTRTTRPATTFTTLGDHTDPESLYLLHGMLPGEVVCTENLTPFLKLLPCKGKAGISSLLDGHKIFDAAWQSMSIDVQPKCNAAGSECHIELTQSIDMVLDIERSKRPQDNPIPRPVSNEELLCDESKSYHSSDICYPSDRVEELSWSIKDVFGRHVPGSCTLAEQSGPALQPICLEVPHERNVMIMSGLEIKSPPGEPELRCYQLNSDEPFDMHLAQQRLSRPHPVDQEMLTAERTITGHGAERGGIQTTITNHDPIFPVSLVYFESLPWFMRPYMHTLQARVTRIPPEMAANHLPTLNSMYYRPAIDRERGTQLELRLTIPPQTTIALSYDFDKAILRYTEYPPDANRGFNVGPAVLRILGETSSDGSERPIYIRTTSLLLPLPTPDFSMPYNVIILTSTIMALAFGSIFNLLTRRIVAVEESPGGRFARIQGQVTSLVVMVKDRLMGKMQKTE